jgi:uncharacterized protein (TIGR03435 family)
MRKTSLIFAIVALGSHPLQNARAQTPKLTFEVASVKKVNESGPPILSRPQIVTPGGDFEAVGTLVRFVMYAYDVADFEVTAGPDWVRTDRFQISAKSGREASVTEVRQMLRSLLEERFSLRTHSAQVQMTHYVLRLARPDGRLGSQLVKNSNDCRLRVLRPPNVPSGAAATSGCGPIDYLARTTSNVLETRVANQTGLEGNFEYFLYAAPERPRSIAGNAVLGIEPSALPSDPNLPAYATALKEQLGLRLDAAKMPVTVVVIDSVQRPSDD